MKKDLFCSFKVLRAFLGLFFVMFLSGFSLKAHDEKALSDEILILRLNETPPTGYLNAETLANTATITDNDPRLVITNPVAGLKVSETRTMLVNLDGLQAGEGLINWIVDNTSATMISGGAGVLAKQSLALIVVVDGESSLSQDMMWTVSDPTIATINTATAEVTATSIADTSKRDIYVVRVSDESMSSPTINLVVTTDQQPEVSGTADPSSTVRLNILSVIYPPRTEDGLAVNESGVWVLPRGVIATLLDGSYDVTVEAELTSGLTVLATVSNAIVVDLAVPAIGTITPVVSRDSSPSLHGTAEPFTTAIVVLEGNTYQAKANSAGIWGIPKGEISPPLADGTYDVTLQVFDDAGNTSPTTDIENVVMIDTVVPPEPTIDEVIKVSESSPEIDGKAEPNTHVEIEVDGIVYYVKTDKNGDFKLGSGVIDPPLEKGKYDVLITVKDEAGNKTEMEYPERLLVGGNQLLVSEGVSPNGDGMNDVLYIDNIERFPENVFKIYNRFGEEVWATKDYDNKENVFKGLSQTSDFTGSNELPVGTYYFYLDLNDGSKPILGFFALYR